MKYKVIGFVILFVCTFHQTNAITTVNPLDYGLNQAETGFQRYAVLLRCHEDAIAHGYGVNYQGIDSIDIDIPTNPSGIPLSYFTDFGGVKISVKNCSNSFFLFRLSNELNPIQVIGTDIDEGNFTSYKSLSNGMKMLVLEDETPWVNRRIGYNEIATRRDLLILKDGFSLNKPISSYSTLTTRIKSNYCNINEREIIIKNLTFIRDASSKYKTYLLRAQNQYKVNISDINVYTPSDDEKYGDAIILMINCAKVKLNDICFYGTYSQERKHGYGVNLDNIYDLEVNRMYARSKWGIFGTNNLQNVTLNDCDINRFDIHCYGRDVKAVNCKFSGLYNQFSSIYGKIEFEKCEFTNFIPILIESSYNAYTPFELSWKNCKFYLDKNHNYLMTLFGVPEAYNERPELRRKCLPNISVVKCKVFLDDDLDKWYLIHTGGVKYEDSFDYIKNIKMRNIRVKGSKGAKFELSTEQLRTTNKLKIVTKIK